MTKGFSSALRNGLGTGFPVIWHIRSFLLLFFLQETNKLFDGPDVLVLIENHFQPFYEFWNENSNLNNVPQYFAVNTISYINIATLFLSGLQRTNGSIVMVSSIGGVIPFPRTAPHCGNKYALHGFFNSLRQDLALQGHKWVSITLCILGGIKTKTATERMKGFPAEKSSIKREPVDEYALAMIRGVALRKQQLYFPWYLSIVEITHFFFPSFAESIIQVATKEKPVEDMWKW